MKKFLLIAVLIGLGFSFAGCSNSGGDAAPKTPDGTAKQPPGDPDPKAGP